MTTVVNVRRDDHDEYIGRAGFGLGDGYFGNPFRLAPGEPRGETLENYKKYFKDRLEKDPEFKERIMSLKGKRIGCWCKPAPCHGDIIAEYLNNTI